MLFLVGEELPSAVARFKCSKVFPFEIMLASTARAVFLPSTLGDNLIAGPYPICR